MAQVSAWGRGRGGRRGAAILAAAAFGLDAIRALAAPSGASCPPTVPSAFAENGADAPLVGRAASSRPLRILAIGSSSTLGVGASAPGRAYPAQLAADLASRWGVAAEVRNAGVSGELSAATLARLTGDLARDPPDLVLWQVGTNDAVAGVDVADFRANVEAGVAAARARRVPIILVDPQFYFGIQDLPRFERFVAVIGEVGAETRVPVFSRFALMKAWAAQSSAALAAALASDGFHMDDQGYACFARALADDIAREDGREANLAAKMRGAEAR